jgi:hypothetical protein
VDAVLGEDSCGLRHKRVLFMLRQRQCLVPRLPGPAAPGSRHVLYKVSLHHHIVHVLAQGSVGPVLSITFIEHCVTAV